MTEHVERTIMYGIYPVLWCDECGPIGAKTDNPSINAAIMRNICSDLKQRSFREKYIKGKRYYEV